MPAASLAAAAASARTSWRLPTAATLATSAVAAAALAAATVATAAVAAAGAAAVDSAAVASTVAAAATVARPARAVATATVAATAGAAGEPASAAGDPANAAGSSSAGDRAPLWGWRDRRGDHWGQLRRAAGSHRAHRRRLGGLLLPSPLPDRLPLLAPSGQGAAATHPLAHWEQPRRHSGQPPCRPVHAGRYARQAGAHCDDASLRLCAVVESGLSASNSAVGDLEPDPIRRLAELSEADAHAAADPVAAPAVCDERLFGAICVP